MEYRQNVRRIYLPITNFSLKSRINDSFRQTSKLSPVNPKLNGILPFRQEENHPKENPKVYGKEHRTTTISEDYRDLQETEPDSTPSLGAGAALPSRKLRLLMGRLSRSYSSLRAQEL